MLISCYAERRERFKDINTKNKTHWEEISEELQKKGVHFTAKSCETKMKNLTRSYVACVDHNKVSGMTERNATSMTNFTKYFHETMPSSQKPYAATLMAQLNEAKRHLRMMKIPEEPPVVKSEKNKLPERKKSVEDLVGHFFSPLNAPDFFCIW